jgi:hypothetical protein
MSAMSEPSAERRTRARHPARGPITLWWTDCTRCTVEGLLVDRSEAGFRVVYGCAALSPGQQVHFQHAGGEGIARTIWTRIVADSIESGFLILSDDLPETD